MSLVLDKMVASVYCCGTEFLFPLGSPNCLPSASAVVLGGIQIFYSQCVPSLSGQ